MVAIVAAVLLAAALVTVVVLYERELRSMTRFLKRGGRSANERICVEFATPGTRGVAAAMNAELDALRDTRTAQEDRQRAFQRDLASLSHDIRTPLAGAQGYLQLYDRTGDPDERARCISEATARLAVMRELTDKLFEYAKAVDADSPLSIDRVEVAPVLAEVLAGAYPQFAERGWEPRLSFEREDVAVLADEDALSRIFANLVTNALRYGATAPRIELRAGGADGEGLGSEAVGRVRVDEKRHAGGAGETTHGAAAGKGTACDADHAGAQAGVERAASFVTVSFANGVPDPAAVKPDQLFERFYRADGARSGDGSGLGLAIVASLCERMDGTATARVEGDELVIEVTLPAA